MTAVQGDHHDVEEMVTVTVTGGLEIMIIMIIVTVIPSHSEDHHDDNERLGKLPIFEVFRWQ